jgi:hypothetical protein
MAEIAWGNREGLQNFRAVRETCANDPIIKNMFDWYDMEREDQIENGLKVLHRLKQLKLAVPINYKTSLFYTNVLNGGVSLMLLKIT